MLYFVGCSRLFSYRQAYLTVPFYVPKVVPYPSLKRNFTNKFFALEDLENLFFLEDNNFIEMFCENKTIAINLKQFFTFATCKFKIFLDFSCFEMKWEL